jgi:hypothetical protein
VRDLDPGLYEVLVTEALQGALEARAGAGSDGGDVDVRGLRAAEAADRIALHCSRVIEQALDAVDDSRRVTVGVEVARALIARLAELTRTDTGATPVEAAQILHAIQDRLPDGRPSAWPEPLIPLLDTTLHTNAPGEPRLVSQLQAEIESADAIDVVMAFVRRSGSGRRSMSCGNWAPRCASPTTCPRLGCTPKAGCSHATRASPPPTSVPRT